MYANLNFPVEVGVLFLFLPFIIAIYSMTNIQNEELSASITAVGIELASLIDRKTGTEYMWRADPAIWGSHAPVLFPIIGGLRGGSYRYQGKEYMLPKHGFVRHNKNILLEEKTENSATFLVQDSPEIRAMYPFDFAFRVTYRLEGRQLLVEHQVLNEGTEKLYFSLGGHPAFRIPLRPKNERYEEYFLAFDRPVDWPSYVVNADGLIGPETRNVPWQENRLPLTHELFSNDALVFKNVDLRRCSIHHEQHGRILTVSFDDFNYLGIWAKPTGDFVCIEPWLGIADAYDTDGELTTKEGILSLGGGEEFMATYIIEVH